MMFVSTHIFKIIIKFGVKSTLFREGAGASFTKLPFFNIVAKMHKCLKLGFSKHFLNLNENIQTNS